MKNIVFILLLALAACKNSTEPSIPTVIFEDHFSDSNSMSNWNHTTDYRGGGQFEVLNGQFVRTQVGHVFYYNKKFTSGNGTYEFKAKGQWVFFWRGSTEDSSSGTALALVNTDGTLYYYECLWADYVYGYHNNSRPRQESIQIGQFLTDSLNQIRIVDADSTARIYVNNQLKLSVVMSRTFRISGYLLDDLLNVLRSVPNGIAQLAYGIEQTERFREGLAKLRTRTGQLMTSFPEAHFPIANRAILEFSEEVDTFVKLFPGEVQTLIMATDNLKTSWHIDVRPYIYALELALAVTPGVFVPEDPNLFTGKDRYLRDITIEVNTAYRNGAYNACSVLLRRLLETLIIKAHTRNGTAAMAQNANGEFYHLTRLIDDVTQNQLFGLTRNAYDAMPDLKRLGDWGAHNPNLLVRITDLEPLKPNARLCFEELLGKV